MFSKIMKCVILVAGHGTLLESEIRRHGPRNLVGIPKSLLPGVGTKKILDSWWNCLNQKHIFTDVFLVTNADKYKVRLQPVPHGPSQRHLTVRKDLTKAMLT